MQALRQREHFIAADDGWRLSVLEVEPATALRGVVIVGHAMMVDRRTILRDDRPSLGAELATAGFRVLVPDLRGHGCSGPRAEVGGVWDFDAIVDDVGRYLDLARALDPRAPIALVGHSLAGLAGLAWIGRNPDAPVAAQVCLACDVWSDDREPSRARRLAKRALIRSTTSIAERYGRLPARRFGAGSNDEALPYWLDYASWARSGRWRSRTRGIDDGEGLAAIPCPTLHVVSAGDRLYGRPASALRFSAPIRRREAWYIGHPSAPPDLRMLRPDHMGMVTDPTMAPLWSAIGDWLGDRLRVR
ncbi:MAG: alpha/beta fold hydrolase [Myxococcales bacterium]|nr:alpha/beta fold hydrolase [Myxococcales bacterium]